MKCKHTCFRNPIAAILVAETDKDFMATIVVSFSSRGPNPDILKVTKMWTSRNSLLLSLQICSENSLISWPLVLTYLLLGLLWHHLPFTKMTPGVSNIMLSPGHPCPSLMAHASGAAAYVKAAHPNRSSAAIKSALMTTGMNIHHSCFHF